jgi:hypothetical protein
MSWFLDFCAACPYYSGEQILWGAAFTLAMVVNTINEESARIAEMEQRLAAEAEWHGARKTYDRFM